MKPRLLLLILGLLLLPVLVVGFSIASLRVRLPVAADQAAIILPCGHKASGYDLNGGGEDFFWCAYGHKFVRQDGIFYAVAR